MSSYQRDELERPDGRNDFGQSYSQNSIGGNAQVHFGNKYFYDTESSLSSTTARSLEHGFRFVQPMGLCLNQAPYIDSKLFIGRESEIKRIHEMLEPNKSSIEQRRLILGGMGGIGKTQLAIAYAKQYQHVHDSVFWLNASDETTLKTSYRSIAEQIFEVQNQQAANTEQILVHVKRWLSVAKNSGWLLIFDNYDEPESYDIETYLPYATHGSIIFTTRLPDQVSGQSLLIRPLDQINYGLQILETRSQRSNVANDPSAQRLAERLAGLPLALATAGAYLHKSTWSFERYLEEYEVKWNVTSRRPIQLREYQDRTLYTTWDLSYRRLEKEDGEAAQFLKLLAYFDHQTIWYGLFQAGVQDDLPEWLINIISDSTEFENVMRVLIDYCFLEVRTTLQSYSMHTCIHDWNLLRLNTTIEPWGYWFAFDCVADLIDREEWDSLGQLRHARLVPHAMQLTHHRFREILEQIPVDRLNMAVYIAQLLKEQLQFTTAAMMYLLVLARYEKTYGPNHTSTLDISFNLGILYRDQDKLDEAEKMYTQALAGYEKALGPNHISILDTVHNLGTLYHDQSKLDEAEEMYKRVLAGCEKALGPNHTSTLYTVHDLGLLYSNQDKLDEAEEMYERALAGFEKALGPNHTSTLSTVHSLGALYRNQSKLEKAEEMYERALAGFEEALGPNHTSTLDTVHSLGVLYHNQGQLEKAEEMYERALAGYKKALGPNHTSTLRSFHSLGVLYSDQGQLDEAEELFERALAGYEKVLGPNHTSTLDTVYCLGNLYRSQGKLDKTEKMYERALAGYEEALGPNHTSTLKPVSGLGLVYYHQDRLNKAEEMYKRVLLAPNRTKVQHESAIFWFPIVLSKEIRSPGINPMSKQNRMATLVQHVKEWCESDKRMVQQLAKALVGIKDDENASTAYLHSFIHANAMSTDFRGIACDGCRREITIAKGCHTCRQCDDTDLCTECVSKHRINDLSLPTCIGHEYCDIGAGVSRILESQDWIDMDTWLDHLQEKYKANTDD